MNQQGNLEFEVSLDTKKLDREKQRVVDVFQNIGREAEKQGEKIDASFETAAKNVGKAFAAIGLTASFQEFGKKVMQVRGEFQKLEVAFGVMLGSAKEADALMQQLTKTAATTPFDLQSVANGAKQLLAYGESSEKVNDTLIRLGNIASGLSIPLGDLVMLFGTTMTQGRLFTQDLRQFMGRGIPLADELAKQFGVAKDQVGELVTAGKVGAEQVRAAIESMTNEGGKFAGLMEKQSQTIAGQLSNLEDAIDSMFNEIGKKSEGVINDTLTIAGTLIENYETIGKILTSLIATYGTYRTAIILTTAAKGVALEMTKGYTLAEVLQIKALIAAEKAQQLLNRTMLNNPYVLAATAVAGLVTYLVLFSKSTDSAQEAQSQMNKVQDEAAKKAAEETEKINLLVEAAKNEKLSLEERQSAIKQLNKIIPEYNAQLDETSGKYKENKKALDDYLKSLAHKYEIEGAKDRLKEIGRAVADARVEINKANSELRKAEVEEEQLARNTGGVYGNTRAENLRQTIKKQNKTLEDALTERSLIYKTYGIDLQKDAAKIPEGASTKTTSSTKTTDKKSGKTKEQIQAELKAQLADLQDISKQAAIERKRLDENLEIEATQNKIDLMNKSAEKIKAQQELNFRREQIDLDRRREDEIKEEIARQKQVFDKQEEINASQNSKYAKKIFSVNDLDVTAIEAIQRRFEELQNQFDLKISQSSQKLLDQQREDMSKYLEEYGTYQQKRVAITEQYQKKIDQATTEGAKMSLRKQMQDALKELNLEELKDQLDWGVIFGDLSKVAKKELQKVKKQLIDFKNSDAYKKQNPEQIKIIEDAINQINENLADRGGLFGGLIDSLDNYKQTVEDLRVAQEEYEQAVTDSEKAEKKKAVQQAKQNKQDAQSTRDKAVDSTIQKLQVLTSTISNLGTAAEFSIQDLGSTVAQVTALFGKAAGEVGGIIGAILEVLGAIGNSGGFDRFLDNVFSNVFGAVGGIFSTVFGQTDLWGSNFDPEVITELTRSNANLEKAMERLTDAMKDQAGSDANSTYQSAKADLEASMRNTQRIIKELSGAYSNGFLGIGGSHSATAHVNDEMNYEDWLRISNIVGKSVNSADDFWNLSSEQMAKVADQATDLWTKIQNAAAEGYQDASSYMDQYIEYYQRLIKLQDLYNETVTQLSFSSAKSDLESLLLDTETDAKDVLDNVSRYIQKALINQILTKSIQSSLRNWYTSFADALKDDVIDAVESAALQTMYADIYNEAERLRDEAMKAAGIDFDTKENTQEASRGGYETVSEETGTQLLGRETAILMQATRIADAFENLVPNIIVNQGSAISILEMQNEFLFNCQNYLENISKNSNELPPMRKDIEKMKRIMEQNF